MVALKNYNKEAKGYSVLRKSRETLGLNKKEMSEKIGISFDLYSKYERRLISNPSLKTFDSMLRYLSVRIDGISYETLSKDFLKERK
jgi:transcriptional regulator with XRE-family HTH domain